MATAGQERREGRQFPNPRLTCHFEKLTLRLSGEIDPEHWPPRGLLCRETTGCLYGRGCS